MHLRYELVFGTHFNQKNNKMKKTMKPYCPPEVEIICLAGERVICDSGYVDDYDVINPWDGVNSAPADEF